MAEVIKRAVELSQDQFGNYVVQHVFEHGKDMHKEAAMKVLKEHVVHLSRQKFSSNVIERCLQHASDKTRDQLIIQMLGKDGEL